MTTGYIPGMVGHLSPAEFAAAVEYDVGTVRRWLRAKHVKARRVGPRGNWWIPESEVKRIIGEPAPQTITADQAKNCLAELLNEIRVGRPGKSA
ncbi:hypothetical protein [Limnoglobus roseus]|uniref:hypothetical protein n=1 Tax=Limnoglobus roseus TaxID=2598579 RepID=UPI0011EB3C35|nr:hypothetical protein [Limnoglobus roseus]